MSLNAFDKFAAGELLGFAKSGIRNKSIAITETSTPQVRDALLRQIQSGVHLHAHIFQFLLARGLYQSFQPELVIQGDFQTAQQALSLPVGRQ